MKKLIKSTIGTLIAGQVLLGGCVIASGWPPPQLVDGAMIIINQSGASQHVNISANNNSVIISGNAGDNVLSNGAGLKVVAKGSTFWPGGVVAQVNDQCGAASTLNQITSSHNIHGNCTVSGDTLTIRG